MSQAPRRLGTALPRIPEEPRQARTLQSGGRLLELAQLLWRGPGEAALLCDLHILGLKAAIPPCREEDDGVAIAIERLDLMRPIAVEHRCLLGKVERHGVLRVQLLDL